MGKSESAAQTFDNGFLCSQAVFSTYCEDLGLDYDTALKIACSFGSGMGYTGSTCGAVTGAYMLIGLKHGKTIPDDNEAKDKTYALVQEFSQRFKDRHGSVQCKDLLGYDISDYNQLQEVRERKLFKLICRDLVKSAAEIVEELLELD